MSASNAQLLQAVQASAEPDAQVLLDDADYRIELHAHATAHDTVVLTFDPILWRMDMRPFGLDFLLKCGVDAITVRKKSEDFYQGLDRERLLTLIGPVLARYRRRLAYGSSLGAYAVLYYGAHGFDMVISSSPRVSVHPVHGIEHWQRKVRFRHERFDPRHPASSPAVIFYDPRDAQDRRFVEEELRPAWPQAEMVPIPFAGHPANQFLAEIGYIPSCVRALVRGEARPPLSRRDKARSGMYHQSLAHACMEHGHLDWALRLGERAMTLSPYLNLGRRTLGEIHLARGEFDASQRHLDWYLERHPQDGPALMARQGVERGRAAAEEATRRTTQEAERLRRAEKEARASAEREAAEAIRIEAERVRREADAQALAEAEAVSRANSPLRRAARRARAWLVKSEDGSPSLAVRMHDKLQAVLPEGSVGIGRDDVVWAYRQILGRAPENEQVIAGHMRQPSVRALVQAFMDSPEYQRRVQLAASTAGSTSATGHAIRKGALRPDGPVVLVHGNCQAPGIANVLAACTGTGEAIPLTTLNLSDEARRAQLAALAPRLDVWVMSPTNRLAREVFAEKAKQGARLVTVPELRFNAFHPDVCYAGLRGSTQLTQQHYNSAIVVWAYRQGLTVEQTAALFDAETFQALGYLDQWNRSVAALREAFGKSDLSADFPVFMQRLQRMGCFMHSPNHPHIGALALLAQAVARQAGIEAFEDPMPGEIVDGLVSVIWPVYPEIALSLGLGAGSTIWRMVVNGRYLHGIEAYVRHAFAAYREQGIAPAELEHRWLDVTLLDQTLAERARALR